MGKQKLSNNQIRELRTIISINKSKGPEVRRAQAILFIDQGIDARGMRTMTDYGRRHAFLLKRRYQAEGIIVVKDRREGQPKKLLTKKQRGEIIGVVTTRSPRECMSGYDTLYWSTALLGRYIKDTYNVVYKSRTSLYLLFRSATFTYHKPGKVSERQNEEEVKKWRTQAAKRIKEAWNDANTVILTEDEMHLSNQTTAQKIWLPKGEYPRIEEARKREARSIYGFLNIKTGVEHAFKTLGQNMYITAEIIPKVRALYQGKKILLLWDQAGWHKGSEAQKAIKEDGNIETLYFPTAAPEEDPQEHGWKNGRSQVSHNAFMQNIDDATDKFVAYLNTTQFPYSLLGFNAIS